MGSNIWCSHENIDTDDGINYWCEDCGSDFDYVNKEQVRKRKEKDEARRKASRSDGKGKPS